jgi:TolB protein
MDPDGSDQVRLTDYEVWEPRLAWSPDSRRIAFESYRDGNLEIYAIDADGSNLTRLTHNPADDGWIAGCGRRAPASP